MSEAEITCSVYGLSQIVLCLVTAEPDDKENVPLKRVNHSPYYSYFTSLKPQVQSYWFFFQMAFSTLFISSTIILNFYLFFIEIIFLVSYFYFIKFIFFIIIITYIRVFALCIMRCGRIRSLRMQLTKWHQKKSRQAGTGISL